MNTAITAVCDNVYKHWTDHFTGRPLVPEIEKLFCLTCKHRIFQMVRGCKN